MRFECGIGLDRMRLVETKELANGVGWEKIGSACRGCVEWDTAVMELDGMDRLGSYIPSHARRHSVVELHSHVRSHRLIPAESGTEWLRPTILQVGRVLSCHIRNAARAHVPYSKPEGLKSGRDGMGGNGARRDETRRDGTGWDGMGWDGMGWDGM